MKACTFHCKSFREISDFSNEWSDVVVALETKDPDGTSKNIFAKKEVTTEIFRIGFRFFAFFQAIFVSFLKR